MPSNKDRLFLALYARGGSAKMPGGEDTYHWALMVGPKVYDQDHDGTRYHAKEVLTSKGFEWAFEELTVTMMATARILIRVLVAKIEHKERLVQLLRQIPIRQEQEGWNCVLWVKEALSQLESSKNILGTSVIDWNSVRNEAMSYCQKKKDQGRWDGKDKFNIRRVPTFDLIERKETVP